MNSSSLAKLANRIRYEKKIAVNTDYDKVVFKVYNNSKLTKSNKCSVKDNRNQTKTEWIKNDITLYVIHHKIENINELRNKDINIGMICEYCRRKTDGLRCENKWKLLICYIASLQQVPEEITPLIY